MAVMSGRVELGFVLLRCVSLRQSGLVAFSLGALRSVAVRCGSYVSITYFLKE